MIFFLACLAVAAGLCVARLIVAIGEENGHRKQEERDRLVDPFDAEGGA